MVFRISWGVETITRNSSRGLRIRGLKGKCGEDIVNTDVESLGYERIIAETDRNINIQ